jgi:CRISPR-associated exonuclease Cas4
MDEDDYLPISGLQHLVFCERQCALIHVERVWVANHLTVEGDHLHARVDDAGSRTRSDVRLARRLALRSHRLRLVGYADIVEFHRDVQAPERENPLPVEYKRGRRGHWLADQVQLCAQAICLEEAFGVAVPEGAVFYAKSQRRRPVVFDGDLRAATERAAARFHELMANGKTPRGVFEKKCRKCSLLEVCLPETTQRDASGRYVASLVGGGG